MSQNSSWVKWTRIRIFFLSWCCRLGRPKLQGSWKTRPGRGKWRRRRRPGFPRRETVPDETVWRCRGRCERWNSRSNTARPQVAAERPNHHRVSLLILDPRLNLEPSAEPLTLPPKLVRDKFAVQRNSVSRKDCRNLVRFIQYNGGGHQTQASAVVGVGQRPKKIYRKIPCAILVISHFLPF